MFSICFFVSLYSLKWPVDRRQDLSVEFLIFRYPLRPVGLLLFYSKLSETY